MKRNYKLLTIVSIAAAVCSCNDSKNRYDMGTYGYDAEYFKSKSIETVELTDAEGCAKVMVIPAYQGRVMTSSADGYQGNSYGWINYKLIDSGEINPQFNPVGGEERFWLGPEGGPFSLYFKKGIEQIYANWLVPAAIDTETYAITEQSQSKVAFAASADFINASDTKLSIGIERSVEMLDRSTVGKTLGTTIPEDVKIVAYKSVNTIANKGVDAWTEKTGMPSIWLLGMFNPTATTTVFIPFNTEATGKVVNDEYFGKVPADRLIIGDGIIYFKIDGLCRTKIGLPNGRATEICGSYDSAKKVLNILKYTLPTQSKKYVNSQWGNQDDPFAGDVINSYNDGPTDTGTVMGPFYEIETSSPAANLAPGETLIHEQCVIHIEGSEAALKAIATDVFGVDLSQVATIF